MLPLPQAEFQYPWVLLLLALVPVIALLRGRAGKPAAMVFSSTALLNQVGHTSKSRAGQWLFFLRLLTLTLLILALARPRVGEGAQEQASSGIDIVLAVDVSKSMLARDFKLNGEDVTRLEVAKRAMRTFIERRGADRIGLIAFAGNPYLVSPLTLNHDWLLKNLDENVCIGRIEDGTAIGSAIGMSVNRLRDLKDAKSRVIVLLTDGVNNAGQIPPLAAAEAAARFETRIYTIAAGSNESVLVYNTDEKGKLIRDRWGRPQLLGNAEPVDETALRKIADMTRGQFYRATDTEGLEAIYRAIDSLEKTEVNVRSHRVYRELFALPLLLALLSLGLEIILVNTVFRRIP